MLDNPTGRSGALLFMERHAKVLTAAAILLCLVWTLFSLSFTVDDSFIVFRYGKTLAETGHWDWNPSGGRTEAYTSFLYAALTAVPAFLGIAPALFFKLFALALLAAFIFRISRYARSPGQRLAAIAIIAASPYFFIHLYAGLETPLFMFLIFEAVMLSTRQLTLGEERYFYMALLLLFLIRPEGVVFAAAALGSRLFLSKSPIRSKKFFACTALLGIAYFAAQWAYFGQPFPNSFYVKTAIYAKVAGLSPVENAIANISHNAVYLATLLLVAFLSRGVIRVFALTSVLVISLVYIPLPTPFIMNYADRFYFQVVWPIVLCCVLAIDNARHSSGASIAVAAMFLLTSVSLGTLFAISTYYPDLAFAHKDVGLRLSQFKDRGYSLLIGDAGALPYYAGWTAYDPRGIADTPVARHGLNEAYLNAAAPDLIFIRTADAQSLETGHPDNIVLNFIKTSGNYEKVAASQFNKEYYLVAFLKKDLPDFQAIAAELAMNEQSSNEFHERSDPHSYPLRHLTNVLSQRYLFK